MKNITKILCIAILTFSCGENTELVKIEEINGVRVVTNLQEGLVEFTEAELRLVRTLGDDDSAESDYFFNRPRDIIKQDDGTLYVLDAGNFRVLKLNDDLQLLSAFGSRGQGPSEFMRPTYFRVDNTGKIYVTDLFKENVIVLSNDGKEIRSFLFKDDQLENPFVGGNIKIGYFFITESDNIIKTPLRPDTSNVAIYDMNGNLLRKFAKRKMYDDPYLFTYGNLTNMAKDNRDNLYIGYSRRNLIEKYSFDGKLQLQITRNSGIVETRTFITRKVIIGRMNRESGEMEVDRIEDRQYMETFTEGIEVDHKGRIWVISRYDNGKEVDNMVWRSHKEFWRFEIFSPEGIMLGRIPVPQDDFSKMRIFGSTMFLIDITMNMVIYEYEIVDL